jgi:filamentous hemagglutinin family protein
MKTWPHQAARILRGNENAHRFICFINGKIRVFTTSLDDINSQVAELFGHLNAGSLLGNPARMAQSLLLALTCAGLPAAALALDPLALPTGYQSVTGNVQFSQSPGVLNVTTNADRSIVNYQSFNVGSQASVNFQLPGSHASILNRVTGGNMSEIYGNITSNGKVFLVNPAGIFFGNGANISVNGLVASTLNITDHNFLNGQYEFSRLPGIAPAGIRVEQGAIINVQNGGSATFLASSFLNNGVINAPGGTLQIGVGDRISLGNDLIGLTVNESLKDTLNQAAVVNNGSLSAEQVKILASVVKDGFKGAIINNTGYIRANKLIDGEGGTVELIADNGAVHNTGIVDASGSQGGQIKLLGTDSLNAGQLLANGQTGNGGRIEVLGTNSVAITGDALLNASGAAGGGTILVGGDRQGLSANIPNAQTAYVGSGARLLADALAQGNGGKVILWSDKVTGFDGAISARGAGVGSLGGFVETSGKQALEIGSGRVDASSPLGQGGQWLLDPLNVTITSSTNNMTSSFDGLGTWTHTPNTSLPGTSLISAALINSALNLGTNVTINTGSTGADSGNITVNSAINKTTGGDATLSLLAANDIQLNQAISASSNKLNVSLRADHDISAAPTGNGVGSLTLNAGVTTNGGNITLSGAAINLKQDLNAGSGSISATASNGAINQSGGNIKANSVSLTATNGTITKTGGTLSTLLLNAQTNTSGKKITLIDTDVNQANLQTNNGNIALTDRDGLSVSAQAGTGTVNITADAGSVLLHSNNGSAGAGINLTGANSGSTFNLLTYHGGISQDAGSTVSGTNLNAESQDPGHQGIAINDADFAVAKFKTVNGLVNYRDRDGAIVNVQAGSGNSNITTFGPGLLSNNGLAEQDLVISSLTNTANNLTYTAYSGNIVHNAGQVLATNVTLDNQDGRIIHNGGLIASTSTTLKTTNGAIDINGGTISSQKVLLLSDSGAITKNGGEIAGDLVKFINNSGDIIHNAGQISANTVKFDNQTGKIIYNGGLINAGSATFNTVQGAIDYNGGILSGQNVTLSSNSGMISKNGGEISGNQILFSNKNGNIEQNLGQISGATVTFDNQGGKIIYNNGLIAATNISLTKTTTGAIEYNGGTISSQNVTLSSDSGTISKNGGEMTGDQILFSNNTGDIVHNLGQISGNNVKFDNQAGKIIYNNGLIAAASSTFNTLNGAIDYNGGTVNTQNITLSSESGTITKNGGEIAGNQVHFNNNTGSILHNGGQVSGDLVTVDNKAGQIIYNGGLIAAQDLQITNQTGGTILNSGLLSGLNTTIDTQSGGIVQNGGAITGDTIRLTSLNGNISLSGAISGNKAIHVTTANTLPGLPGAIQIGSTGTLSSTTGSVYLNTDNLGLDGFINAKFVQLWPWNLNVGVNVNTGAIGGLSLSQSIFDHINTAGGVGSNMIMLGHQNYTGDITLGQLNLSNHSLTDIIFNAPRVFESTPNSDPFGSYNLTMADNRSVYFTAGASQFSDWNTAPGGILYGDNTNPFADLDIAVKGTGIINVNLQGSAPSSANRFEMVNGVGNKAFINVLTVNSLSSLQDPLTGFGSYRHLPSLLKPIPNTQIVNLVKGNTITLSGSKLNNTNYSFGLPTFIPFVTNISL